MIFLFPVEKWLEDFLGKKLKCFYAVLTEDEVRELYLPGKIADTFRKDCFTESDSRFSQRAQEINIESKKHDYHSSVEPQ